MIPWPSLIRADYLTGTTPVDRIDGLRGAGVGVVLVGWPNSTPYSFGWDGRTRFDYRPLERHLGSLLGADPNLRFVLSFGSLHGTPLAWALDHPEELAVFNCGRRMQQASLGSDLWTADSADAARRFAAHFSSPPWSDRVVGFHLYSTGVDWHGVGETFVDLPPKETPKGVAFPLEGDLSAPMLRAFRRFLGERYGHDDALREAWRNPQVSLADAPLPDRVSLRSPSTASRDYFDCYNRLNADLALAWAAAIRKGAPGRPVLLGHGTTFGWPSSNLHPQGSGHNDAARLLDSGLLDLLVSGAVAPVDEGIPLSQHALASLRLRGVGHLHVVEAPALANRDVDTQCQALTLAAGYAACQGSRLAWGEPRLGPGSMQDSRGKFARLPYDHPEIRGLVARLNTWHANHLLRRTGSTAEVAVFTSPAASHLRALETSFNTTKMEAFRNGPLLHAGVLFDEYLLTDFDRVHSRYKAWILLDCADMDPKTWGVLRRHPERTLQACAPGARFTPADLRAFARSCGVHLWLESDDVLFADSHSLVAAFRTSGPKRIHLPAPRIPKDPWGREGPGCRTQTLEIVARAGEARIIDLDSD